MQGRRLCPAQGRWVRSCLAACFLGSWERHSNSDSGSEWRSFPTRGSCLALECRAAGLGRQRREECAGAPKPQSASNTQEASLCTGSAQVWGWQVLALSPGTPRGLSLHGGGSWAFGTTEDAGVCGLCAF